jgi:hypothetical protein
MSNIVLRRSDILDLVDIGARQFDAMLQRGQVPWSKRDDGRSWGEFSTDDAYRLALAFALNRAGLTYADAGRLVRVEFESLTKRPLGEVGDLFLGKFITKLHAADSGVRTHMEFAAPQEALFDVMTKLRDAVAPGEPIIAHTVVNATEVMRETLARATLHGLLDPRLQALAKKVRAV